MTETLTKASAATSPTNILLVDDEPRNLAVLRSILEVPDLNLISTTSPDDALLSLVQHEFACIILDIQMPHTSGLELARIIKTRKRNQHVPIIFLTAYFLEEKDVLQGYGAGAVDYLTKPINPQILRSKVGVFVDLYRTARALTAANSALESEVGQRKKAEEALRLANMELETRVEERTAELTMTEKRYRQVVYSLPAAVYTTDADGRVTLYNEAAVALWGREPEIGKDVWCGSYKIFRPDGSELPADQMSHGHHLENRGGRAGRRNHHRAPGRQPPERSALSWSRFLTPREKWSARSTCWWTSPSGNVQKKPRGGWQPLLNFRMTPSSART